MTAIRLISALFLVFLNGFFVAAEFSIVKVRATRIQQLAEEGNNKAKVAKVVITQLDEHLSATQLGITLASLALGWIGEPVFEHMFETPLRALSNLLPMVNADYIVDGGSFLIGFSLITMLHIVLGELVPKSMAITQAEAVTLWCAGPLRLFYKVLRWPIGAMNALANAILRRMGMQPASESELSHSNEELRMLVSASAKGGHLDETERTMIDNVFGFSERVAREIMVPRNEMVCLYVEDTIAESVATALQEGHTRYPLCDGDKENILGMIHLRDLFEKHDELKDLREIMRPIVMIPETVSVSHLLKQFQRQKSQIAVLVDEYGGTAGLITLEDLVEEIVGDIQDEFDEEEPELKQVAPDTFEVDGAMLIEEAQEQLGLRLDEIEGVDTMGGYVLSVLAAKPEVGQEIVVGNHSIQVMEVEGFRVVRVRIVRRSLDLHPAVEAEPA